MLSGIDYPVWVNLPGVCWKTRVRLVRHACFFMLSGGVEPGVAALFFAIARQYGIASFWDIGANFGYYTWLVKSISPAAEVRMYEPDSDNLALVRETLSRAELTGITVRQVAASDASGVRRFGRDCVSGSTGGIVENSPSYSELEWQVPTRVEVVETVSLDDERLVAGHVDLIKIDVEGHEEQVIRGAFETIRRDRPILIFECFHGAGEIISALRPLGYAFADAERMDTEIRAATNFLALPERHHASIEGLKNSWSAQMARV